MNSNPEKSASLAKTLIETQQAMAAMGAHIAQLSRVLYLTVQAAGGQVTVNEAKISPLWRLNKKRDEATGELTLQCAETPPPTEEQKDALVEHLRGTSINMIEAQQKLGINEWPADYLAFSIASRLLWFEGKWVDAEIAKQAALARGQN